MASNLRDSALRSTPEVQEEHPYHFEVSVETFNGYEPTLSLRAVLPASAIDQIAKIYEAAVKRHGGGHEAGA